MCKYTHLIRICSFTPMNDLTTNSHFMLTKHITDFLYLCRTETLRWKTDLHFAYSTTFVSNSPFKVLKLRVYQKDVEAYSLCLMHTQSSLVHVKYSRNTSQPS